MRYTTTRTGCLLAAALMLLAIVPQPPPAFSADVKEPAGEIEFFEKRIRPLLIEKCLACHNRKRAESGLRLDSREALLEGGDRGPAVQPGQPRASRLIQAVQYGDEELQMPPEGRLTDSEIDSLARWIAAGSPWPAATALQNARNSEQEHWAFHSIQRPALPPVRNAEWARTPIDRFVLARLESTPIAPSPPANRRTFIRRATFDLWGLPPAPEEVDAFLTDSSPDAVPRLIDRLLASPRYGERWARHWLDVARYADNKGYVFFEDKNYPWAYTYRDYVIRALNADLSYDRFLLEQLAADQLDLDDQRSLAAMGFLTLGAHFMNNTHDIIDDRIDVVTRGLMGLTVTCARCHDHKYDPIPQADYYSLYGVFRSSYEPLVQPLLTAPPDTDEYRQYAAELQKREAALVDFVTARHGELVQGARERADEYLQAAYARHGHPPADDFMLLVGKGELNPAMLLRWQRYLESPRRVHDSIWRPWRNLISASAETFDQQLSELLIEPAAADAAPLNSLLRTRLGAAAPTSMEELAEVYGAVLRDVNQQWLAALQQAEQAGTDRPTQLADPAAEQLRQVLYGPDAPADAPMALDWGFLSLFPDRPTQAEYKKLLKAVEEWVTTAAGAPPRAMALFDADTAYQPRIFRRGQPNRLGPAVPRQFPAVLDPQRQPFRQGSGRLELAEAIVDPTNPLTARVIVNRIWMHHFGKGLVTTPSDFGLRCEPPSHPQLLDYLAARFIQQGWSIKALHREIMTSAVYQQASLDREACLPIDPENRLLWKMNRRRLDFESLRDSVLAVSDHLQHRLEGPPEDLFGSHASHPRRSIYGYVDRMDVSPLLTTFDFPNPIASSSQRVSTTVPPQALYLMNNSFTAAAANRLAIQMTQRYPNPPACITAIYARLFARPATPQEFELAQGFLGDQPDDQAWARYIHGLLMTNEFLFVD